MTVRSGSPGWYLRRLSRMGPREVGGRVGDTVRRRRWRSAPPDCPGVTGARFTAVLPAGTIAAVPPDAAKRLVAEADRLMAGHAEYFGVDRDDLADPDWFHDPRTGRRAPSGYAFDVPYRDEEAVGDIKQIWELSRHQHLTVLAAAYAVTGDERYAERAAGHLRSWWAANAPLRGVHWTSGIELGIRLLSWVWVRRLLDGWPGAAHLFEGNPVALNQIWHHQRWLAAFPSRGSSANNHVIAETAGQFAAGCAFGWFPSSARWRADALRSLERQLRGNTFGSGLNRELASEYHGLVLELGLAAVAEADAADVPVPASVRLVLLRMTDALAAVVDNRLRPPRQGDADDGHGLVVDGSGTDRWGSLLATGDAVFGRLAWWPTVTGTDVRTPLLAALIRPYAKGAPHRPCPARRAGRPFRRRRHDRPAGAGEDLVPLRRRSARVPVHRRARPRGRAVRGGPARRGRRARRPGDVLLPRAARVAALLPVDARPQHRRAGRRGPVRLRRPVPVDPACPQPRAGRGRLRRGTARWCAEHDGYRPSVHRRRVELTAASQELRVVDEVRGPRRAVRLAFHLGPAVAADLVDSRAALTWSVDGEDRSAVLDLPGQLSWRAHRGESEPPLGWYSAGFGRKEPATTLVGTGFTDGTEDFTTVLGFHG